MRESFEVSFCELELDHGVELDARERRIGLSRRPVDVVREVAPGADREQVQELVVDTDARSLQVRSLGPELAPGEGRDDRLLPQPLVEGVERPVALDLGLAETGAELIALGIVDGGIPVVDVVDPEAEWLGAVDVRDGGTEGEVRLVEAA